MEYKVWLEDKWVTVADLTGVGFKEEEDGTLSFKSEKLGKWVNINSMEGLQEHIDNKEIHVTKEEKEKWNKSLEDSKKYTDSKMTPEEISKVLPEGSTTQKGIVKISNPFEAIQGTGAVDLVIPERRYVSDKTITDSNIANIQRHTQDQGDKLDKHLSATNPHKIKATDVGLGEVKNYPLATQETAIGTGNTSYLTPYSGRILVQSQLDQNISKKVTLNGSYTPMIAQNYEGYHFFIEESSAIIQYWVDAIKTDVPEMNIYATGSPLIMKVETWVGLKKNLFQRVTFSRLKKGDYVFSGQLVVIRLKSVEGGWMAFELENGSVEGLPASATPDKHISGVSSFYYYENGYPRNSYGYSLVSKGNNNGALQLISSGDQELLFRVGRTKTKWNEWREALSVNMNKEITEKINVKLGSMDYGGKGSIRNIIFYKEGTTPNASSGNIGDIFLMVAN